MLYHGTRPMVSFVLEGEPVGKQRARVFAQGGKVRAVTPTKTREYECRLRLEGQALVRLKQRVGEPWKCGGRYALSVIAHFGNKRHRDLDNVVKACCDALNDVFWYDDSQVDEIYVRREYDKEKPRLEFRAWLIGE